MRRKSGWMGTVLFAAVFFVLMAQGLGAKSKKPKHPYDIFDHEMHNGIYEMAGVSCDFCHADPASFEDHDKINKQGCHACHKDPNGPMPSIKPCAHCHINGWYPKPDNHKAGWIAKHQSHAKQDAAYCTQCHANRMFCIDCHQRRDTIQTRMHPRNFLFHHSIEARANPRKCDTCHTIQYCNACHAGKGDSSK